MGEQVQVMKKSYFDVLGLCCSSEIPLVENILKQLDGVKDVSVIVASRTVIVIHDTRLVSPTHIVNALNQARLEANIKVRGQSNHHQHKWPSPYAIASGTLLLLSLLKFVYHPLRWLAVGAVAAGILPIAWKGLAAARNFRIDINILVIVAVAGTIAMHDYLEAGTIVFLFNIAEWLESRASHKATAEMSSLMSIAPQKAEIAETGEVVDVDEVELNTVVAVKAGEIIPIDGIVVDGRSEVDEKTMTGESFPVSKQKDSTVWAGTINLNGYISVRTTALAEECVVAKMAKLVEEAQNNKSKTQRIVDKCAKYYTPAILVGAIGLAVIPLCFGFHNKDYWFHLSLVVLVSSCPCALVLSTPVATFCALTKAAKSGILIKGGDYLETLAKIKTVAFDKTGTITKGEFVVVDFQSLSAEISVETLLYWVSSVESKSSHPLAIPLVQYGRSLGIEPKTEDVMDFQNYPGEGVYGSIDGKDVFIGNKRLATKAGCETALSFEGGGVKGGKTVGYVFVGPTLVGIFSLSDECRTGVVEAIAKLKLMKIRTAMLTGDNQEAALHAQNQINHALDLVHAELLPEDKSKIIEVLKRDGKTVMVGDGINDAPALATADIGISMGISGSALATETGHIVLMSNDIRKIPSVISLARRARRTVIVNVVLSISTKAAILALAFAGHPLVWAAVLADTGTCIVVILNSMLLLHEPHKHAHHGHGHGSKSVGKKDRCCSKKSASSGQDHEHGHKHGSKCVTKTDQCCGKKNALSGQDHEHGHKHGSNCVTKTDQCCNKKNVLSGQDHEHGHKHGSKCVTKTDQCCSKKSALSGPDHEHGHKHGSSCVAKTDQCCSKKNASSGHDHEHGHKHGSNCVAKTDQCCRKKNVLLGQNQEHGHCSSKENMCSSANTEHLNHEHHHHLESHKISCEPSICAGKVTCESRNSTSYDGIDHLIEICNTIDGCSKGDASKHSENHHHVEASCQKNLERVSKPGHCDHDSGENHSHERKSDHCFELVDESDIEMGQCDDFKEETHLHGCCSSLEKREIGGCCKSFMKECHHHQHLSHGFGGQLTVVTE